MPILAIDLTLPPSGALETAGDGTAPADALEDGVGVDNGLLELLPAGREVHLGQTLTQWPSSVGE